MHCAVLVEDFLAQDSTCFPQMNLREIRFLPGNYVAVSEVATRRLPSI